jgi:hypothetical protein
MNVGELKAILNQYPDDMEVIVEKWSDYRILNKEGGVRVEHGVPQAEWIMRSHSTMSRENREKAKDYLALTA